MSEKNEIALLTMFKTEMEKISKANSNLRKWTYSVIAIFGLGICGGLYWAGSINQKVEDMSSHVAEIKEQVDRIESKYNEMVFFLVREFGFEPEVRGRIASSHQTKL